MTIKERFNIRLKRIREYKQCISRCDAAAQKLMEYEKNITAYIGPTDNDRKMSCIKTYYTFVKYGGVMDTGDIHIITRYCPWFHKDESCQMKYGCSCRYKNMKYNDLKAVLRKENAVKRESFYRIFGRIK